MNIVCATDFGQESGRAAEVAASLARRLGDRLVLVHALRPSEMADAFDDEPAVTGAALEMAADSSLTFEKLRLSSICSDITTRLVSGSPESVVPQVAEFLDARLIVCGAHGGRAPARWLLGSTASRLSRVAPVPLLVVRGPVDGFLGWGGDENRALRVLVAFDLDETFEAEMDFAEGLLEAGPCEIEFVHSAGRPTSREREFAQIASDERRVHLVQGSPAEEVARLVSEEHFDLVVVGTHARRGTARLWHPSIAERILRRSPTPVAVARMGMSIRDRPSVGVELGGDLGRLGGELGELRDELGELGDELSP